MRNVHNLALCSILDFRVLRRGRWDSGAKSAGSVQVNRTRFSPAGLAAISRLNITSRYITRARKHRSASLSTLAFPFPFPFPFPFLPFHRARPRDLRRQNSGAGCTGCILIRERRSARETSFKVPVLLYRFCRLANRPLSGSSTARRPGFSNGIPLNLCDCRARQFAVLPPFLAFHFYTYHRQKDNEEETTSSGNDALSRRGSFATPTPPSVEELSRDPRRFILPSFLASRRPQKKIPRIVDEKKKKIGRGRAKIRNSAISGDFFALAFLN